MAGLNSLLKAQHPYGVTYKPLGDVAQYSTARISASEVNAGNYIGVENILPDKRGKRPSNYIPKGGMFTRYEAKDILIGNIRPYLKKIWLSDCIGGTNGDVLVIHKVNENISADFLYYVLSSDCFFAYNVQHSKGAKMPRGNKEAIMRYPVPLPSLSVQHEIVRILDTFSELTAELTA